MLLIIFRDLDVDIRDAVCEHKASGSDGKQSLQEAQADIQELFTRIKDIKMRSEKSEEMVIESTRYKKCYALLSAYISVSRVS